MKANRFRFRAWDRKLQRWSEATDSLSGMNLQDIMENEFDPTDFIHDDLVFMQSTGLCDRTGKEIFEGDLVRGRPRPDKRLIPKQHIFVVSWCDATATWDVNAPPAFENWLMSDLLLCDADSDGVIVGNVYENPELVK